jgi:hypothetical protein
MKARSFSSSRRLRSRIFIDSAAAMMASALISPIWLTASWVRDPNQRSLGFSGFPIFVAVRRVQEADSMTTAGFVSAAEVSVLHPEGK